jgi:hypothetical protein
MEQFKCFLELGKAKRISIVDEVGEPKQEMRRRRRGVEERELNMLLGKIEEWHLLNLGKSNFYSNVLLESFLF